MELEPPKLLCKNSAGRKDGMWTMSWVSFLIWAIHAIVLGLFGGSAIQFTVGSAEIQLAIPATFEWLSLTALLPLWAGYIVRRHGLFMKKEE